MFLTVAVSLRIAALASQAASMEAMLAEKERAHAIHTQALQRQCDHLERDLAQATAESTRVAAELVTVHSSERGLEEVRAKLDERVRKLKAALQQSADQNRALLEEGDALREQSACDHRTISELGQHPAVRTL